MSNENERRKGTRHTTTTATADAGGELVSDAETGEVKDLTTMPAADGIIAADKLGTIANLFDKGWSQERTFWVGDPAAKNPKVPLYMGELVGPGPDIEINDMNAEKDEATGDWKKRPIPTYMFYPLNIETLEPNRKILDTMICNAQCFGACKRYEALAKSQGKVARVFFQWNGKRETRMGRQMNDVDTRYVLVDRKVVDVKAEDATKG